MAGEDQITTDAADDSWEDLVVSILSVNQYSLQRTYGLIDGLRKQGLCDPRYLSEWDHSEIVHRLRAAGCDRGTFMTNLFAVRLANLGALITNGGIEMCTRIISGKKIRAIEELLLPVNGIGPKVIANFCVLRDIHRT